MISKNLSIIREELSKKIPDFRLILKLSAREQMLTDYVNRHLIDLGIRKHMLDDCFNKSIDPPDDLTLIEKAYFKALAKLIPRWTKEMTLDLLAFHGGGIEMDKAETSTVQTDTNFVDRYIQSRRVEKDSYDLREHRRGYSDGKNDCHANSPFEIRSGYDDWSFNGEVRGRMVQVRPDGNFWNTTPEPTRGTSPEYTDGYREGYEEARESLRGSLRARGW